MKITHFIPVYAPAWQYGGPVLSVSRLCEALAKNGHDITVITTNAGLPDLYQNDLCKPVQRRGVNVIYFPVKRNKNPIYSEQLRLSLPELLLGAELVHISSIWQPLGIPIQKASHKLAIPILHSLRGALSPYSFKMRWGKKIPYYWLRERPWLQRAAGLHVTTQQEKQEVERLGLKPPCYLLPNPVELGELKLDAQNGADWRKQHSIKLNTPVFLICGRQHHKKGLDLLPKVFQKLSQFQWHLVIIGNDDDGSGQNLTQKLNQHGLGDRITQLRSQPASTLGAIYNAADLLLLPSRHENFGNVVIEAMACGCAVLISDQTGVGGDLLHSAPNCFGAVLAREQKLWADWLQTWLQHHQRAGIQSAEWAAQRFSSSAVAKKTIAIYQEILENRRE